MHGIAPLWFVLTRRFGRDGTDIDVKAITRGPNHGSIRHCHRSWCSQEKAAVRHGHTSLPATMVHSTFTFLIFSAGILSKFSEMRHNIRVLSRCDRAKPPLTSS